MLNESVKNNFGYFENKAIIDSSVLIDLAMSIDTLNTIHDMYPDEIANTVTELGKSCIDTEELYLPEYAIEEVDKFFAPGGGNYTKKYYLSKDIQNQLYDYMGLMQTAYLNEEAKVIIEKTNKDRIGTDFLFIDKCIFMCGFSIKADAIISQNSRHFPLIQKIVCEYYNPVLKQLIFNDYDIVSGLGKLRNRRFPEVSESIASILLRKIRKLV